MIDYSKTIQVPSNSQDIRNVVGDLWDCTLFARRSSNFDDSTIVPIDSEKYVFISKYYLDSSLYRFAVINISNQGHFILLEKLARFYQSKKLVNYVSSAYSDRVIIRENNFDLFYDGVCKIFKVKGFAQIDPVFDFNECKGCGVIYLLPSGGG